MAGRNAYGKSAGDRRAERRVESWAASNPVTVITVTLALVFLLGTPQVRTIVFDPPSVSNLGLDADGLRAALSWAYLLVLGVGYLIVASSLLDPRSVETEVETRSTATGLTGVAHRVIHAGRLFGVWLVSRLLVHTATATPSTARKGIGLLFIGVSVPVILPHQQFLDVQTLLGLDRATESLIGTLLAAAGLWLVMARLADDPGRPKMPRERALWDHQVRLSEGIGRSIELVALSCLVGELLWWVLGLASFAEHASTGWRSYTVWGSAHVAILLLVFGRIADMAGRRTGTRLMIGSVIALILYLISSWPVTLGENPNTRPRFGYELVHVNEEVVLGDGWVDEKQVEQAEILTNDWFDQVEARLASMSRDEPVLFVAASGGGSRAAIWATYVFEALERTPLDAVLPNRPPRKLPAYGLPTLADRVLLVSSVSGGSVGTAEFYRGRGPSPPEPHKPFRLQNSLLNQVREAYSEEKARVCKIDGFAGYEHCKEGAPDLFSPLSWPVTSVRADRVSSDFNAPALRGIVMPGIERGESVSHFWQDQFEWDSRTGAPEAGPPPLLLINATEVQTGLRLVAGSPPMPPGLLWDSGIPEKMPREKGETEGEYRARVYWDGLGDPDGSSTRAITDIDPDLDVPVSEAVRMSANFPWGFDLPRLNVDINRDGDAAAETNALVLDGGVLDNTGIDTFAALLDRLDYLSSEPSDADAPPRLRLRARNLLDQLARRGVLLLEIDSGVRPGRPGPAQRVFETVLMPLHALDEAGFVRESVSKLRHVDRLQDVLGHHAQMLATEESGDSGVGELYGTRVAYVTYTANHRESIMTAWALNPSQKGDLLLRFVLEDGRKRSELLRDWLELRGQNRTIRSVRAEEPGNERFYALLELVEELSRRSMEASAAERRDRRLAEARLAADWRSGQEKTTSHRVADRHRAAQSGPDAEPLEGWIHLGFWDAQASQWMTRTLNFDRDTAPQDLAGASLTTRQAVEVLPNKPNQYGTLRPAEAVVARGARVTIAHASDDVPVVVNWEESGLWFAKVSESVPTRR